MSIQDLTLGLVEAAKKIAESSAAYKKFFNDSLKKFGVTSPEELSAEKKKEFYNHIDANWNSDDEPGTDGKKDKPKTDVDEGKGMPPWLKKIKGKKDDEDSEDEVKEEHDEDDEDEDEDEKEVEEGLNASKKFSKDLKAGYAKEEHDEDDEEDEDEDEKEVKENSAIGGYRNSSRDGQQGPSSKPKPKAKPISTGKNSNRPAGFGDAQDDSIRSQIERLYKQRDSLDATASSAREAGNDDKADDFEYKGSRLSDKIRELKDKLKDKNESNTLDANLLERVLKELNIG